MDLSFPTRDRENVTRPPLSRVLRLQEIQTAQVTVYTASIMALKVELGRIACSVLTGSGM